MKDLYLKHINTNISSMKGDLIKAFAKRIKCLWSYDSPDRVLDTLSLKDHIQRFCPHFNGHTQQEAQQFLRYLLGGSD